MNVRDYVTKEDEYYMLDRGFSYVWFEDPRRPGFQQERGWVGSYAHSMLLVERQKFGSGWRAGVLLRKSSSKNWSTFWIAGGTRGIPIHKPGGSLVFDDAASAFIHAEVEGWGGFKSAEPADRDAAVNFLQSVGE